LAAEVGAPNVDVEEAGLHDLPLYCDNFHSHDFKIRHHSHAFVFELMTVHHVEPTVAIEPDQHIHSFSVA
jgi:hypothetical protein